jgi:hypothetical protein
MTTSPWSSLKAAFDTLAALAPAEREPRLAALALDAAAAAELRSLLRHHDAATGGAGFLALPAAVPAGSDTGVEGEGAPAQAALPGQRLGAWAIVRRIGAGGMGEVFEARRADGRYEGRAAIKLLKPGLEGAAVLERFALERHALARLNHPHIARLLDAGASDTGAPYFVMEHVEGRPFHDAARALGLGLRERLELFLQLADAVAHAHRNLLVHRDLKPGNVLVTADAQVKLLDFGIAKALDPLEAAGAALELTAAGQRPYTPHHASPEQVRGEPVSTATDVYGLGVLLYQLLTGVRPTGHAARSAAEAVQAVLEEQPVRPSRLGPPPPDDPQWGAMRAALAGDLDQVLMTALEKAPERRYASVDAFAADVRAFLEGRPVRARGAAPLYVLAKFLRRNRWPALAAIVGGVGLASGLAATLLEGRTAAALGLLGLAGGLGLALVQAERARAARDEARAAEHESQARLGDIRDITRDLVFRFGDAVSYLPGGMQIKEALLQDALRTLDRLATGRDRDPALLADVANTYARLAELQGSDQALSLGKPDAGRDNALKAIELAAPLLATRRDDWRLHSWTARAHLVLAQVHRSHGRIHEGLAAMAAAIEVLKPVDLRHADDLGVVSVMGQQASNLVTLAQLHDRRAAAEGGPAKEALALYAQAEAAYRALEGQRERLERIDATGRPEEPKAYAQVLTQLGSIVGSVSRLHLREGRLGPALEGAQQAFALAMRSVAADPATQVWRNGLVSESLHLARVHLLRGEGDAALAASDHCHEAALALTRAEGEQPRWAVHGTRLGPVRAEALAMAGRHDEARAVWAQVLPQAEAEAAAAPPGPAGEAARQALEGLRLRRAALG